MTTRLTGLILAMGFLSLFHQQAASAQISPPVQNSQYTVFPPNLGESFPFRQGYPIPSEHNSEMHAHALLTLNQSHIQSGSVANVDIRVYNDSGFEYFYNVYWNGLLARPGALALYDSQKHYIDDLAAFRAGSMRWPAAQDWTPIQEPGYAGTTFSFWMPRVASGTYYLQVIFFNALVQPRPTVIAHGTALPPNAHKELFRSNVVKIVISASKPIL